MHGPSYRGDMGKKKEINVVTRRVRKLVGLAEKEKKKDIQQEKKKKLLINLTLYTHFPPVISSSAPDFIMCSDVSAVSKGASLSLSSLVVASFSPNTSCPIGNSMWHTAWYSCVDIMECILRATFQPNDMQLYLRRNATALNCTVFQTENLLRARRSVNLSFAN